MGAPAEDPGVAIARHLADFERRADFQRRRKRFFRHLNEVLHVVIGLPAAVLAGAATVSALKDARPGLVAAFAGAATVLSAAQLFLRASDRAGFNRTQEADFGRLAKAASRMREIELPLHAGDVAWAKQASKTLDQYEKRFALLLSRALLGAS